METEKNHIATALLRPSKFIDVNSIQNDFLMMFATRRKGRAKNLWIPATPELSNEEWDKWEWKERVEVSKKKKS